MSNTIQDFKTTLRGGGARPNLFEVLLTDMPGGGDFSPTDFKVLCKAAQLPASNIGSIDVPFRGRIFKVAGDRTFDTWTVTVINDEDFKIRRSFELWMQFIGQYGDASGSTNPNDYMRSATVRQLTRNASTTGATAFGGDLSSITAGQYKFEGIFPTNISAIDLSYDTSDTIEEFTVEFQVQYWTPFTGEN
jgi:hypothetical protein